MDKTNKDYDPKQDIGAATRLLASILQKGVDFTRHIDAQSNILIGISSATFLFAATRIGSGDKSFLLLGVFSALASLTGLFAIHPPRFMRKQRQNESLLYNKKVASFPSAEDYRRELSKIVGNQDAIVREYATEIYNIHKYFYRPKRTLFKISRNLLLAGILFFLIVLILNHYR